MPRLDFNTDKLNIYPWGLFCFPNTSSDIDRPSDFPFLNLSISVLQIPFDIQKKKVYFYSFTPKLCLLIAVL